MLKEIKNIRTQIEVSRKRRLEEELARGKKEKEDIYSAAIARKAESKKVAEETGKCHRRIEFLASLAKASSFIVIFSVSVFLVSKVFIHGREKVPVLQLMEPVHPGEASAMRAEKFIDKTLESLKNEGSSAFENIWSSKSDDGCRFYGAGLMELFKYKKPFSKTVFRGFSSSEYEISCSFEDGGTLRFSVCEEKGKHVLICVE